MSYVLSTKKMEVMLKEGYTKSSMASELGISEEDLEDDLKKMYHEDTLAKINRRFKSNEKKAKRTRSTENVMPQETKVNESYTAEFIPAPEVAIDSFSLTVDDDIVNLDDVLTQIEDKTAQLNTLERRHQTSASNRSSIMNRICAKEKELLRLQNTVNQIQNELETMIAEFNAEATKMAELNNQKAKVELELEALQSKRAELETLYILVYSNGEIEINNEAILPEQIPENWEEIYHSFYGNEILDSLTGFAQKSLAKFFALLKVLPKNRKQDICFENNDMQAAFETLKGGILS